MNMQKKIPVLFLIVLSFSVGTFAQADNAVYFKGAIKENRDLLRKNIIQNTITRNLSLPLNDDTEENWSDAFGGIELLHYKSSWADGRITLAFDSIEKTSPGFQRSILELAYTCYPGRFIKQVSNLLKSCTDARIFAMCAEYMMLSKINRFAGINLEEKREQLVKSQKDEAIIGQLFSRMQSRPPQKKGIAITVILSRDFLKTNTILYSFQRKNRNYPGISLIRDSAGNFIRDKNGIFWVPQLARSISNLPGYLTDGNTPQGIFRMGGLDTSKTYFIGPTPNIQLTMPFETSLQHFFNDSTITDTVWSETWYKKLLPAGLKNYRPLYESFYAGEAGRTEIIAHGTTVDPEYYAGEIFYPQTPTIGCLSTKETWSPVNGKRLVSDQQKLVNALLMAGGANGYCVVVEIDDAEKPVTINEILPFLKPAIKK